MKHTPGPWELGRFYPTFEGAKISSAEITQVGEMGILGMVYRPDRSREEGEANARLFAAAPQLLTALRRCVKDLEGFGMTSYHARALIAKVREPAP